MNMHVSPSPMSLKQTRLLDAADFIEQVPASQFDMGQWPCCIAGHIERRIAGLQSDDDHAAHVAGDWMLLTSTEKAKLFMPSIFDLFPELHRQMVEGDGSSLDGKALSNVSRAWAARVLRHLAYTGDIDWQLARKRMPWMVKRLADVG